MIEGLLIGSDAKLTIDYSTLESNEHLDLPVANQVNTFPAWQNKYPQKIRRQIRYESKYLFRSYNRYHLCPK